jgi:hypothetical protein
MKLIATWDEDGCMDISTATGWLKQEACCFGDKRAASRYQVYYAFGRALG